MKHKHKFFTMLTAIAVILSSFGIIGTGIAPSVFTQPIEVNAASVDYPVQLLRIGVYDNSKNLNISGYTDNSVVIISDDNGSQNQNWRFDYVGTNSTGSFYKIANMGCGRLLTPIEYTLSEGTSCVTYGSESHTSQHWYVIPISQDIYGNNLYYKIVNYDNPNLALTCGSNNKVTLSAYTDASNQKFLLKSAGLQGFAGYCNDMNGNQKASVIGGVLGETVEVTNFDELKAACTDTSVKTIIITKNISGKTSGYDLITGYDGNDRYICRDNFIYVAANKTIIGSYGANTLHNVFFRTYEGTAYGAGNNIIFRNITLTHDKELNYDNNWEFSYGWNFWLDHCTFVGHDTINGASTGSPDFDKFINFKGDTNFITISDCNIGKGEYGVLLGYPADTEEIYQQYNGVPCVTLCDNYYKDTVTRAPGLMRYGYFHSMNNYVLNFDMGYTIYTAAKLYAEGCYYDAGTGKGSVVNDTVSSSDISSKYPGYYTEVNSVLVNSKYSLTANTASACTWRPSSNYTYTAKSAEEAKSYCTKYAGAQSSIENMTYASFDKAGMPSAGYITAPDTVPTEPVTTTTPVKKATVVNAQNGDTLDASWLTEGEISSELKINDTYSITASDEKIVNVYKQDITTADGKYKVNSAIALGGAGNTSQRSVQINAKSAGTLAIYMSSSNASVSRNVNLLDKDGNILQTVENVVGTEVNAYSFTIPSGGTYYVTSASSGLNVYYAEIQYGSVTPPTVKGDVNADGEFTVADVVMLQKWLICADSLTDWQAGDLCKDGVINVFDLSMMKHLLMSKINV